MSLLIAVISLIIIKKKYKKTPGDILLAWSLVDLF